MRRTWIGAAAAAALTAGSAGYAGTLERQPGQDQAPASQGTQKGLDQTTGASNMDTSGEGAQSAASQEMQKRQGQEAAGTSNMDRRAERAQSAQAPMGESQDQKPAGQGSREPGNPGKD